MGLDQGKRGSRECPELEFEEVTVSQSTSGRGYLPLLPREMGQGGKAARRSRPLTEDRGVVPGVFMLLHEAYFKVSGSDLL